MLQFACNFIMFSAFRSRKIIKINLCHGIIKKKIELKLNILAMSKKVVGLVATGFDFAFAVMAIVDKS